MSGGPAAVRWRHQLEAWAIPQALLDGVPWNPYEWPAELFARRDRQRVAEGVEPPTFDIVMGFEPRTVLDIGAGTGGSCLTLAERGVHVTALERDEGMAQRLRSEAARRGLEVEVIEAAWPEAASSAPVVDVVTTSHVVHNVPDLAPFLAAMADHATRAVVIQEFEQHPWAHLGPYYKALHGLDRPTGPTVDDLVAVVYETLGVEPEVLRWDSGRPMWFQDRHELYLFYGRRLVVPEQRWQELNDVLGPYVVERPDGTVQLEERTKQLATVWWEV
ncbi:MAG: class I SAM-dependent methyltransferase [Acidimicrobiia bacterium]|nr:class I SAM-dependent methyltransferase [Acidimicrobiia bacterium]